MYMMMKHLHLTAVALTILFFIVRFYFFTDGRYIEQSKNQVKNSDIHITGSAHYQAIHSKKILNHDSNIGFESDYVSVGLFNQFKKTLNHINWQPFSGIIEIIAAVKDNFEIPSGVNFPTYSYNVCHNVHLVM